jgi:hypothetical protein
MKKLVFESLDEYLQYKYEDGKIDDYGYEISNNKSVKESLNESKILKIGNVELPFIVVKKENWPEGKNDPTEFNENKGVVKVRSDYDYKKDPLNWIRHELIHYLYHKKGIADDGKEYPKNNTEEAAYKYQFRFFKKKGIKNLEDIIDKLGKRHHLKVLKKYWDAA